jgi:hypothetical protein
MSYAYTPSTGANTNTDSTAWQQRRPNPSSVADKINNILSSHDSDGLPMYKDKPYNYSSSGKKRAPLYRQKRVVGLIVGVIVTILFWTGAFSSSKGDGVVTGVKKESKLGSLLKGKAKASVWEDRREKVRDAFKISWKAYEDHAWGMLGLLSIAVAHADTTYRLRHVPPGIESRRTNDSQRHGLDHY